MEKRGLVIFGLIFLSMFLFSVNLASATITSCQVTQTCTSGYTQVMKLSSGTNAHGALISGANFASNYYLCCNGGESTTCTGSNKILGLSAGSNAHTQAPAQSNYDYDVCYGSLSCTSSVGSSCPSNYPIATVSISSDSNAHVAQFSYYAEKICCKYVSTGSTTVCGNGIKETGEECDDGNTNSYDGCSNICKVESSSGYVCDNANPTCCYNEDPSIGAYWTKTGQTGEFTEGVIEVGNNLGLNVPEKICVANPGVPSFSVYKVNYLFGKIINVFNPSTLIKTVNGYAIYNTLSASWIVEATDLSKLGVGSSDIYFITTNPNDGNEIKSDTVSVTVNSVPVEDSCASLGHTCGYVGSEFCGNCPSDQTCSAQGICVPSTDCTVTGCPNGQTCNSTTKTCEGTITCPSTYECGTYNGLNCGSCGVGETCTNNQCVPTTTSCAISSASWSKLTATEGDVVNLNVALSNCNGQIASFVVKEKDGSGNPDDSVNVTPSSQTVSTGATSVSTTWTAEYQDDTDGLQSNPPEYTFTVTIGSLSRTSGELSVNKLEDEYCTVNGISTCSMYDSSHCEADPCNVAKNSVGDFDSCGFGYDCGCALTSGDECAGTVSPWTTCPNGVINTGEQCDGTEWGPITNCTDLGYTGGTLSCNGCMFDTSQCTGKTTGPCGNGIVNTGEQCDKPSLPFTNCTKFDSFTGGILDCNSYCLLSTRSCLGGGSVVTTEAGCVYVDTSNDNCDDSILERNVVATWTGTGLQPEWCASYTDTLYCPAQIKVPFFGIVQLIVAIIAIIIIYYFIKLNQSKKKKAKRKNKKY